VVRRAGALEDLVMSGAFWAGKRVFLTGHTGFKGAWAALWLTRMGAHVFGYARAPATEPSLYSLAGVSGILAGETIGDVNDRAGLDAAVAAAGPDVVFHMAAQALVRASYRDPVETFRTNVMGTVHLLDALRAISTVRAVVVVTTDKCYENDEAGRAFVETDPLGGHDPYSASKACQEIAAAAMRSSYFGGDALVGTARAGNVLGGGDWAEDRLIPDIVRAAASGGELVVRNPEAVRPWQYVLDPLAGYFLLAEALYRGDRAFAGPWNFAPPLESAVTVRSVISTFLENFGRPARIEMAPQAREHEAHLLRLDATKARERLRWTPRFDLRSTLAETATWYRAIANGVSAIEACDAAFAHMEARQ
jgi:CDP-glucose 4,6-dehydratase